LQAFFLPDAWHRQGPVAELQCAFICCGFYVMSEPIRLSKRLIELVNCSRREAELYIEGGWVSVNGVVVDEPQHKVSDEKVELHPDAKAEPLNPVTLLVYQGDTAASGIPVLDETGLWPEDASGIRPLNGHFRRLRELAPLQPHATGLQVLSQDWRCERKLTDDLFKLEQEYIIELHSEIDEVSLKKLNQPFTMRGMPLPACKVSRQSEQKLRVAVKNPKPGQFVFMCESMGLKVLTMKRIRIGALSMGKMSAGQWRYMAGWEKF
jgi:23S rRNA pseudouridine2604 synthase